LGRDDLVVDPEDGRPHDGLGAATTRAAGVFMPNRFAPSARTRSAAIAATARMSRNLASSASCSARTSALGLGGAPSLYEMPTETWLSIAPKMPEVIVLPARALTSASSMPSRLAA